LTNPELFQRVGIPPPKGCLLFGPPGKYHRPSSHSSDRCLGTGKTLLARAVASQLDCNFLKVVSSAIVDKYIGESARMIREMFAYAKDHQACFIFMDEIDAIGEELPHLSVCFLASILRSLCPGGRRFSEGTSADREIQRTLMEVSGDRSKETAGQHCGLVAQSNGWLRHVG
jgi:26S proteasome regulatory subunit T4